MITHGLFLQQKSYEILHYLLIQIPLVSPFHQGGPLTLLSQAHHLIQALLGCLVGPAAQVVRQIHAHLVPPVLHLFPAHHRGQVVLSLLAVQECPVAQGFPVARVLLVAPVPQATQAVLFLQSGLAPPPSR